MPIGTSSGTTNVSLFQQNAAPMIWAQVYATVATQAINWISDYVSLRSFLCSTPTINVTLASQATKWSTTSASGLLLNPLTFAIKIVSVFHGEVAPVLNATLVLICPPETFAKWLIHFAYPSTTVDRYAPVVRTDTIGPTEDATLANDLKISLLSMLKLYIKHYWYDLNSNITNGAVTTI